MCIHLDESKSTISLESRLNNVSKVLEQGNQIILGGIWGEVADVASGLPSRGLLDNHVVALDTMSREMMVTKWSSRGHAHRRHGLLLGDGWLALLVGPVAADGARSKPFTVHRAQSLLSILAFSKCHEAVASGAAGLHIPHHSSFRDRSEGREGLQKNFVIDFIGQITDEDVEVVGGVFFVGGIRLVSPVDANFLHYVRDMSINASSWYLRPGGPVVR